MKLLRRRAKAFDIQVQDLTLHITASEDFAEESRAAALSFWEQLEAYGPATRISARPSGALTRVATDAPPIVQEVVSAATPPASGRCSPSEARSWTRSGGYLAEQTREVTVACDGDYFIKAKKRMKVAREAPRRRADHDRARALAEGSGCRPRWAAGAAAPGPTGSR